MYSSAFLQGLTGSAVLSRCPPFHHARSAMVHVNKCGGSGGLASKGGTRGQEARRTLQSSMSYLSSRPDQSTSLCRALDSYGSRLSEPCPACPRAYLVKRGISSLMFTMVTRSTVEAVRFPLSLTPTRRLKLSG